MSEPLFDVRHVTKKFHQFTALDDVSLRIMPNEVVVIIGASGSGKSTLLRCMNLLIEPDEGQILFDGRDITSTDISIDSVRKEIGMVFQQFNLFLHLTVAANIQLPLQKVLKLDSKEIDKRIYQVLKTVDLEEKINNYPGELSGGQQQRVAIARVLAMRPRCIFFDEPTSALDPELTGEVLQVMKRLVTDFHYTLVVVTHEIPFAKEVATRVIYMDKGSIICEGSPKEIFENPSNERLRSFLSRILKI